MFCMYCDICTFVVFILFFIEIKALQSLCCICLNMFDKNKVSESEKSEVFVEQKIYHCKINDNYGVLHITPFGLSH